MAEAMAATIRARVEPALADAVETLATRQGFTVSQYVRHLAMRATELDERSMDDPPEDDADLIERAVSGLAGAGYALMERARNADEAGRDSLLRHLIAFAVYQSAPRVDPQNMRVYAEMVGRRMGRA